MEQKQKPKFLNVLKIRLPVTGVASIAHRVSGALLFLSIPLLIYGFGRSLQDASGFAQVQGFFAQPAVKLLLTVLLWATVHHLLAGIRFLLLDVNIGGGLRAARASAWVVNIGSLVVLGLLCLGIWL